MGTKKVTKWNRITDQIQEKYTKWYLDSETKSENPKSKPKDPKKEWEGMMETTRLQTKISEEVTRLRLKAKRNKTNRKGQGNKNSNGSLDFYLN